MNQIKIESVLRSRTLEMFSDKWYKKTSKNILDVFEQKENEDIDVNKELIFERFKECLVVGEVYDSKKLYLGLNQNISQKKMTMLLYEYCKKYDLEYISKRTHKSRNFVLKLK